VDKSCALRRSSVSRLQEVKVSAPTGKKSKYKCDVLDNEQRTNGREDTAENHDSLYDYTMLDACGVLLESTS
jgi:hypothetical protein